LLPGAPGCMAVVTSRNQLTPLVAAEGAHPLTLGLLAPGEARDLLAHRLGVERVTREPDAVEEIIARCDRLPLGLGIAASHAAVRPDFPLAVLAARLRDAAGGLDAFQGGDAATDVRVVFSWSYQALSAAAARLFRLLGLHPGPDIGTPAVASLAGLPPPRAQTLLTELVRAHLLIEHTRAGTPSTICCAPTPPNRRGRRRRRRTPARPCAGCSTTTCTPRTPPLWCWIRPGRPFHWTSRGPVSHHTDRAITTRRWPGSRPSTRYYGRPSIRPPPGDSTVGPGNWPGP
jgi:hypothetical protein